MQEVEQERSQRISRMSHELRTPITSINGFAELLMGDDSVSGEAREFAESSTPKLNASPKDQHRPHRSPTRTRHSTTVTSDKYE